MKVRWGDQLTPTSVNTIVIQDCPEWDRYKNLYKFFSVQGVRMEYKPWDYNQGTGNIVQEELLVGSSIDGIDPNITNIRLAVDFHCQKASRNMKKYVGVAKARFRNGSAQVSTISAGSGNQRWLDVISGRKYHHGVTLFTPQNVGIPQDGTSAGIMYVTFYLWFKTQRIDT